MVFNFRLILWIAAQSNARPFFNYLKYACSHKSGGILIAIQCVFECMWVGRNGEKERERERAVIQSHVKVLNWHVRALHAQTQTLLLDGCDFLFLLHLACTHCTCMVLFYLYIAFRCARSHSLLLTLTIFSSCTFFTVNYLLFDFTHAILNFSLLFSCCRDVGALNLFYFILFSGRSRIMWNDK